MSLFGKNRAPRHDVPNTGSKVAAVALSALMLWQSFGAYTPAYAITAGGGSSEAQSEVTAEPQNEEASEAEAMPTSDAQDEEPSQNEATVANGTVSDEELGRLTSEVFDVTVTASTVSSVDAYLFFQNSPTASPDSNGRSEWLPSDGRTDLLMSVNIQGAVWSYNPSPQAYNCYNNVSNRVVSWPDGSTGSSWEIKKASYGTYWTSVFNAWKSTLEKERDTTITEDDVEAIILHPYKISYFWINGSKQYHLDCKVEVECKKAITAVFYLQDAGASGFTQYGEGLNYTLVNGSATVAAPATAPADTKTKDGVTYKFMGWYTDEACTQSVSFPDTVTSNVSYYAKYVPMDQTIKVNYYLEGTTTPVAPSKSISQLAKGQTVTESAIDVAGYELVSEKTKTAVAGTDTEINFYYKASEVGYAVEYYWKGSDTPIETNSVTGTVGQKVTVSPKSFDGYTAVSSDSQSITLDKDASKNVIKFYYYKNVELKANSDSVTYDGKEHSVSGFSGAPEGADFSAVTVGAAGTDAGDYPAEFAEDTVGTVDGTDSYIVAGAKPGNLHISPVTDEVTIKVKGNTDTLTYDGNSHSVEGYSIQSTLPTGVTEDDVLLGGVAKVTGTNAGTYYMGLSAKNFSLSEQAAKNYTNVKFWVFDGELTVAKRSVVLTSASAEKTYNGKALTNNKVTVSGDGFVSGQGATYSVTGSQTEVGESENAFTYTLSAGTDANNYDVKTVFGTLKVTKAGDATPSKKDDDKKSNDGKDDGSAAKKSATPKTGDALLANEALAAAGGTGALGVIAAALRRRKK